MSTLFAGYQDSTVPLPRLAPETSGADGDVADPDIADLSADGMTVDTIVSAVITEPGTGTVMTESAPRTVVESAPRTVVESAPRTAVESAPGTVVEPDAGPLEAVGGASSRRGRWIDLCVYGAFVLVGLWVTSRFWPGIGHRVSAVDPSDQAFFEWMLAHGARVVTHFDSPLFTSRMNAPLGVNLMANTSILALSIPLTPITLWLGPSFSYALLIALGLAATGGAWYYVLSRHVVRSRSAAIIGGAIAGFGPGMIAHANGHPNLVAQFLVPFLAWRTLRLREPGRAVPNGVALGLLVAVQVFINEEILFITALAMALLLGCLAIGYRSTLRTAIRPFLTGAGVALLVAGTLLAYPLWQQFFGPASYRGLNQDLQAYGSDLAAFPAFATRTVLGGFSDNAKLAPNLAEQNAFFGWPLILTFAVAIYWVRRSALAIGLAITGLVLASFSLGPKVIVNGVHTSVSAPWAYLCHLPIFDSVVPTRLSLFVLPVLAVLIALAHDHVLTQYGRDRTVRIARARFAWFALLAVALGGLAPTPIPTVPLAATPSFFTSGAWRGYVSADQTVVPVPLPQEGSVSGLFWAATTNLAVRLPRGYFLGPDPAHDNVAIFGAPPRATTTLLDKVIAKNRPAVVRASDRRSTIADLRYWHAGVVVQVPGGPADRAVRQTISDLLGFKPKFSGGVWVWDVRRLVAGERSVLG